MDARLFIAKLGESLYRDGFGSTISKGMTALTRKRVQDDFDVRYGTDTGGIEPLWKLHISSPNRYRGVRYQATGQDELIDAVQFIGDDPQAFTFVDVGCGKGRTLLVAANLGFKQVIGVEFAAELVAIAKRNAARLGIQNITVLHRDAAEFQFPDDDDLMVYFYNPFNREVMSRVCANLCKVCTRKVYVLYNKAECADLLDQSGMFTWIGVPPCRPRIQIWKSSAYAC